MRESINEFVSNTLSDLADKYNIPESFIPQLVALIEKYPNMEICGQKNALRDDLVKVIGNLKDQGLLG